MLSKYHSCTLNSRSLEAVRRFTNSILTFNYSAAFFLQFLINEHRICIYTTYNGNVIASVSGSVELDHRDPRGHIYTLAVAPAHRRCGLGSALIHELENKLLSTAASKGLLLRSFVLEALVKDTAACTFYERNGYERGALSPSLCGSMMVSLVKHLGAYPGSVNSLDMGGQMLAV